nr:hypothetical protein [uncultured Mucilaginibacter sp.]
MKNIKHLHRLMALAIVILLSHTVFGQAGVNWPKGPMMTNARITETGELEITPSKTSSGTDFDYLNGKWVMEHKKLKSRLTNSNEWEEFTSYDENQSILQGVGNTDIYKATLDGKPFEGLTVRLFNPKTKLWSLYWAASNAGVMEPPVVGSFEGSIGKFFCKDIYKGKPVIVVFVWDKTDPENPVWHQAFSPDNGRTWEWNWMNVSHRIK